MDILIKGMEMPKSCYSEVYSENGYCPFHFFDYHGRSHCSISACKCLKTRRPKDCSLVEVPPHGKLVNLDDVYEAINREIVPKGIFLSDFYKAFADIPTVLEANNE